MERKITLIGILIMLAILTAGYAYAVPSCAFGGNVTDINGNPIDGTNVKAYLNGTETLIGTGMKTVTGYGIAIENASDKYIIFGVAGKVADQGPQYCDGKGLFTPLNLSVKDSNDNIPSTPPPSSPSSGGPSGRSGGSSGCVSVWQCTAWTTCSQARTQTRTCTDKNNCGTTTGKPVEIQTCNYIPPITTAAQEEETEPETTSGEPEPATAEKPPVIDDTTEEGLGGITGWFFQNITGENKWMGIGVIILILLAGLLFYFFVRKKKRKKK